MKWVKGLDSLLNKAESVLLILFLGTMIVLAFAQVVLRNVFSEGLLWGEILLRHLVLWIGFLGAALATSNDRHINIDAFTRFLAPRVRTGIKVVTNVFAGIVCYLLLKAAVAFVGAEKDSLNNVFGQIPAWYAEIIIPVGFGLLSFHFFVRALVDAMNVVRHEERAE
ncbi:MAG: TRAP transporter small permease [Bacteroidota bacterium]